jgi:hypothetical protein
MSAWLQFYQTVRDPLWPDCDTEDSYPLLPDFIRQECETVHGYVPGSFKHAVREPLLVHLISQVPESILIAAIAEIDNIDWPQSQSQTQTNLFIQAYQADDSKYQGAMAAITPNRPRFINQNLPIFLRTHAVMDNNITDWADYYKNIESVDTEWQVRLPSVTKLLHWAQQKMNARAIGNSVLNCMLPGGNVHLHTDLGIYFDTYCRFHIPLQTNSQVTFSGASDSQEHMHVGWLYRLNNKCQHQVQNDGTTNRVHLVVDLLLDQPNNIFDTT